MFLCLIPTIDLTKCPTHFFGFWIWLGPFFGRVFSWSWDAVIPESVATSICQLESSYRGETPDENWLPWQLAAKSMECLLCWKKMSLRLLMQWCLPDLCFVTMLYQYHWMENLKSIPCCCPTWFMKISNPTFRTFCIRMCSVEFSREDLYSTIYRLVMQTSTLVW